MKIKKCYKVISKQRLDNLILDSFKGHKRLSIFIAKGLRCSEKNCHRIGTYIVTWRQKGGGIHTDIFSQDGVLMTVDHIIPVSKGGSDEIENKQIMCARCNSKKSNRLLNATGVKYKHKEYKLGIFRLSIFKLKNKFCLRFELAWGWDN